MSTICNIFSKYLFTFEKLWQDLIKNLLFHFTILLSTEVPKPLKLHFKLQLNFVVFTYFIFGM